MASTLAVDKIKTLAGVAIGWPPADGAANTVLGTDGLGQLSFRADSAGEVSKGSDIASADPLVITTGANYFICTGTTGFNDMTVGADRHFYLEFSGILTMTHNAGVLDLPGGGPIATVAGDVGEFYSTAANVVTCVNYTRVGGVINADINAGAAIADTKISLGTAIQAYDTDTAKTDLDQSWTGSQRATYVANTNGTFDLNTGQNFVCTVSTGTITITFSNIPNGQSGFIKLINSGATMAAYTGSGITKVDATLLATISTAGTYLISYFSDGTDVWLTTSAIYT